MQINNQILLESETRQDYVGDTEAEYAESRCCCCKVAYFTIGGFIFLGHWRRRLTVPIILSILYLLSFVVFIFDTYGTYPNLYSASLAYFFTGFFFICVIFSYLLVIIKGPGYVPYNWAKTRQRHYTWEESMKSMALYADQAEFARSTLDRPKRSCFSNEARRFVLRADHFCIWAKSWIGLKNHRFFALLCIYSFLYSLSILGFRYWMYKDIITGVSKFKYFYILGIVTVVVLGYFGSLSLFHFIKTIRNLARNVTTLEEWGGRLNEWNRGCCNNFEEVCGSRKYAICWPFPCVWCLEPLEDGFYDEDHNDRSLISEAFQNSPPE
ncbi:DHHC zinc finger domain containing protein [Tritrichomonas foetus]|uniref:Palmitoyltransferase n=1 Tax=Tritrichomonas foetus TaxID=1144522 RepID=A0A1J4JSG8_9EUKA|nr:DHHC zinc finger domain containing protein [Tritrichomonas foetus]|eukprot:OHT01995.1 DHHC zinc finger domain containing protein [Tritrichomonas foetus]